MDAESSRGKRKTLSGALRALKKARNKIAPPSINYFAGEMREIKKLLNAVDDTNGRIEVLEKSLEGLEKKIDMYTVQLYRKDGETERVARKRLFRNIPEATGEARLFQLGNTKLLQRLNACCEAIDVSYWMWAGSAVAVAGRQSAIPWDDDIDVCMMREDFEKLRDYVNNETKYCLTTVYDYFSRNIQHRFISKDSRISNFIDVVVCDWASTKSPRREKEYMQIVSKMHDIMDTDSKLEYWRRHVYLETPGETKSHQYNMQQFDLNLDEFYLCKGRILEIVRNARSEAQKKGILCDKVEADAIAYGVDNLFNIKGRQNIWPKEVILPIKRVPYEQINAMTANRNDAFCDIIYPNWPFIPNSATAYRHQPEALNVDETKEKLTEFLNDDSQD